MDCPLKEAGLHNAIETLTEEVRMCIQCFKYLDLSNYSKISIIRTMIIRISGLIQTLMNVRFLM